MANIYAKSINNITTLGGDLIVEFNEKIAEMKKAKCDGFIFFVSNKTTLTIKNIINVYYVDLDAISKNPQLFEYDNKHGIHFRGSRWEYDQLANVGVLIHQYSNIDLLEHFKKSKMYKNFVNEQGIHKYNLGQYIEHKFYRKTLKMIDQDNHKSPIDARTRIKGIGIKNVQIKTCVVSAANNGKSRSNGI